MRVTLEDKDGFPWTASTGLGWIVLIVAFTSGAAALALGLYLALWIWSKGRSAFPLCGFAFVTISFPLCFVLHATAADILATVAAVLWLVSTFALRREIMDYFRESEGWNITIGPFFTLLWSVVYINYCINPLTFDHSAKGPISLNLGAKSNPQQ
jgi:hypothetical protein